MGTMNVSLTKELHGYVETAVGGEAGPNRAPRRLRGGGNFSKDKIIPFNINSL
jgi:hypothetical protein